MINSKIVDIASLNIGDFFEIRIDKEKDKLFTAVYVGKKIIPSIAISLGYDATEKLHCFIVDHGGFKQEYVSYGDKKVVKTTKSFEKTIFDVDYAITIYDHYKHYTIKDGVYTRHNTAKMMYKYLAKTVDAKFVGYDYELASDAIVDWNYIEKLRE